MRHKGAKSRMKSRSRTSEFGVTAPTERQPSAAWRVAEQLDSLRRRAFRLETRRTYSVCQMGAAGVRGV